MRLFCVVLVASSVSVRAEVPVLADEIIATVDGRSVLLSELDLDARLRLVAAESDRALAVRLTPEQLALALEALVDDLIVFAEAERLQVFDVTPAQVDDALADLRWQAGAPFDKLLETHEIDAQTIRDVLRRRLRAERYLEGRFRVAARARDADVQAWVAAHPEDGSPAQVRQMLSAEKFRRLCEAFIAGVRKRAQVVVLRDFRGATLDTASSGVVAAPERAPQKRVAAQ